MATLIFTFDTGAVPLVRIVNAFATAYRYKEKLPDGSDNPESKSDFTRRMVAAYIHDVVVSEEHKTALATVQPGDLDGDLKKEGR